MHGTVVRDGPVPIDDPIREHWRATGGAHDVVSHKTRPQLAFFCAPSPSRQIGCWVPQLHSDVGVARPTVWMKLTRLRSVCHTAAIDLAVW